MPVTARKQTFLEDSRLLVEFREWDSQRPPFISPMFLNYFKHVGEDGNRYVDVRNAFNPIDHFPGDRPICETIAYSRLKSEIGETAGWLINIHQKQQALDMIEARGRQLLKLAKAILRRNPKGVAKALGIADLNQNRTRFRKKYKHSQDIGNIWLELHFGWEPLVKDIYASVEILDLPFFNKKARSKSPWVETKYNLDVYGRDNVVVRTQVRQGCTVELANPNLYSSNALGLTNPASVIWDAIPFSFVFDWFNTLGTYLNSFTDFLGLELKYERNSVKMESVTTTYAGREGTGWGTGTPLVYDVATKTTTTAVRRRTGLIGPSVRFRPLKGPSAIRAATAISLLVQHLPNK